MSELVTFEQAKNLRNLGYNRECRNYYLFDKGNGTKHDSLVQGKEFKEWNLLDSQNTTIGYCSAPTVSEALDFIREKYQHKGIYISVRFGDGCGKPMYYGEMQDYSSLKSTATGNYNIYPEAENVLLNAVLAYLKKRGNDE